MDRIINSKVDKQSIYEIYRACRLCGAGAGYKMPIIQNVIDIAGEEVELKRKIRECVQIEVNQDDKMPPLICELCVDKVNDFYEFLEMCRQTNMRTRKRLGLPMQSRKGSDLSDCILGVTEPVYLNENSEEPCSKPSSRHTRNKSSVVKKPEVKATKSEVKAKKPEMKTKIENNSRSARGRGPSPRARSPSPRTTRHSRENEDNVSLSKYKHQSKRPTRLPPPPTKSILKKEPKIEEKHISRSKRLREPPKPEVPQKRVKLSVKPVAKLVAKPVRVKPPPPPPPPPTPTFRCSICRQQSKTPQANGNHMRSHTVTFTSPKLACDSCCSWFSTAEEAASHHRRHAARNRPYHCRGCDSPYPRRRDYDAHAETGCYPWREVPDLKCPVCWRLFPTNRLLDSHRCPGEDARPGGKCTKCNRSYALLKNLKKHEGTCTAKKRSELAVDPALLAQMRPLQIRFARCDELLTTSGDHYLVAGVNENYGLDPKCVYPYVNSASLNCNRMVNIKSELDEFYCEEDYIHWDSDVSTDDDVTDKERLVYPLSTLSLKMLFSQKCLGRVPRKKRRIKAEKSVFDSLMNNEFDISADIDNIIDDLGDDDDDDVDAKNDNDSVGRRQDIDAMISEDNDSDKKENVSNNSCDDEKEINDLLTNKGKDETNQSVVKEIAVKNGEKVSEDSLRNDNNENNDRIANDDEKDINNSTDNKSEVKEANRNVQKSDETDTIQNNELSLSKDNYSASESLVESKYSCTNVSETSQGESTDDVSKVNEEIESIPRISHVNDISDDYNGKDNLGNDKVPKEGAVDDKVNTNSDIVKENVLVKNNESESPDNDQKDDINEKSKENNDFLCKTELISKITGDIIENMEKDIIKNNKGVDFQKAEINKEIANSTNDSEHYNNKEMGSNDKPLNGEPEEKSVKLNTDGLNDVCDAEIDDKKLMDDSNKHIVEADCGNKNIALRNTNKSIYSEEDAIISDSKIYNDDKSDSKMADDTKRDGKIDNDDKSDGEIKGSDKVEESKITLDDLIPKYKSDSRSMALDSVSDDEFNFDSC